MVEKKIYIGSVSDDNELSIKAGIDDNSISSPKIINGTVTGEKISDNAIKTSHLKNKSVTDEKINSVSASKVLYDNGDGTTNTIQEEINTILSKVGDFDSSGGNDGKYYSITLFFFKNGDNRYEISFFRKGNYVFGRISGIGSAGVTALSSANTYSNGYYNTSAATTTTSGDYVGATYSTGNAVFPPPGFRPNVSAQGRGNVFLDKKNTLITIPFVPIDDTTGALKASSSKTPGFGYWQIFKNQEGNINPPLSSSGKIDFSSYGIRQYTNVTSSCERTGYFSYLTIDSTPTLEGIKEAGYEDKTKDADAIKNFTYSVGGEEFGSTPILTHSNL